MKQCHVSNGKNRDGKQSFSWISYLFLPQTTLRSSRFKSLSAVSVDCSLFATFLFLYYRSLREWRNEFV